MWVSYTEIPPEGLSVDIRESPGDAFLKTEGIRIYGPIEFKGRLDKIEKDVIVRGDLKTGAEVLCARCLEAFVLPIEALLEVEYRVKERIVEEEEIEVEEEEIEVYYYTRNRIDLSDAIRDQVLLAIPMKPLCDGACKGLCEKCGADLNRGPCGCPGKDIDPRLQVLKTLKKELEE